MNEIVEKLMKPFPPEAIKQREGAGRRNFDYVEGENVIERLIEATGGVFDVDVIEGPDLVSYPKRTGEATAFWMAKVRLTIPGLGSRTQVGTATPENEDAPKSAVTDGLKKAATLFGVALQLYESGQKPARQQARPPASSANNGKVKVLNTSGAACPHCHAPDGKSHGDNCPLVTERAA